MFTNPNKVMSILLATVSLVSIFAMLHHPSVSSVDVAQQIAEINAEAPTNTLVHGVLIAFTVTISLCLTQYAKLRGFARTRILFGSILYWLGSIIMILAALMSGIVGPEMAAHYAQASDNELTVFKGIFALKSEMNQAFAYCAVYCWSAAIACWAIDMLQQQHFTKLLGAISLLAALGITISLLSGWLTLNVFGMTVILVVISLWQLAISKLIFLAPDIKP